MAAVLPKFTRQNRTFFLFSYEYIKNSACATFPSANRPYLRPAAARGRFSALPAGSNYRFTIHQPHPRRKRRFTTFHSPETSSPPSQISPCEEDLSYYPLPESAGTIDAGNNLDRTNWPSSVCTGPNLQVRPQRKRENAHVPHQLRFHNIIDTGHSDLTTPPWAPILERILSSPLTTYIL